MTQPTILLDQLYVVKVPEGSKKHHLSFTGKTLTSEDQSIFYKNPGDDELDEWSMIDLPAGTWEIICTSKECTEEQAKGIVRQIMNGFYEDYNSWLDMSGFEGYDKATDSLRSLLISKKLNPETNYIILKKTA